ncbi:hypothetical protein KIN20_025433 [Parelaphostrongylus tenuis]|uniref:UBR-type domain-containing protein n=1 Tax=Parelaphostrongylus tenuis TaxID=148309 RepID=A0AAD5N8U1_PARTN|nr:hypothetical protein KIN20_025433 [Parelaphostrongylus tenuis]
MLRRMLVQRRNRDVSTEETRNPLSNGTEDDVEDRVITIQELVDESERNDLIDRMLFGVQDSRVCTYPEGYKPRQAIFACLTCAEDPEVNEAGICFGCSENCHDDHDVVRLYTKRRFRCDCGNSKFKRKCTLFEEKSASNERNAYDHNFAGLFCVCNKPYPCEIDETMYQCVVCEDWFHLSHLDENFAKLVEQMEENLEQSGFSLVCKSCSSRLPFLSRLSVDEADNGIVCMSTVTEAKEGPVLLVYGFRERLCRCRSCLDYYTRSGCEFLIDADDSIETFTEENIEKTKDRREPDEKAITNMLVQTAGMDAAIHVLKGFNDLKNNLAMFLIEKREEGVDVITPEHVTSFFDKFKRRRIEEHFEGRHLSFVETAPVVAPLSSLCISRAKLR